MPSRGSLPTDTISGRMTMVSQGDKPACFETISSQATFIQPAEKPQAGNERLKKGDLLLGRYEVLAELGQGGMGVVYKCFDRTGGVEVAVKGLPPEVSHDASSMEEIRENFQLVSGLRHPGIVGIRNLEADSGTGDYYLVMDLACGKNMRRWAKSHQGPEHLQAKLAIVDEIAAALDYAHSRRIMHRDIKPENVMVDEDGHPHVLDFGLASQIRSSMSRVSLVVRSQSGTPSYKAPEQWRGQPQNARTDQYSLGVLAYELIAGYLPFDSEDMAILRMSVLGEPVAVIPDIPAYMNEAFERALAKNPQERFSSCKEFVDALKGKKPEPAVNHPVENTTEVVAPARTVASAPATARTPARAVPAVVPARYEAKGRSCGCIVSALIAALVAIVAVVAQFGLNTWESVKEWMHQPTEEKPPETSKELSIDGLKNRSTGRGSSERKRVQCPLCGGKKAIIVEKTCQSCNGSGCVPNPAAQVGQVVNVVGDIFNAIEGGRRGLSMPRMSQGPSELTCQSCGGSGCVNETQLCTKCRGDGSVWK